MRNRQAGRELEGCASGKLEGELEGSWRDAQTANWRGGGKEAGGGANGKLEERWKMDAQTASWKESWMRDAQAANWRVVGGSVRKRQRGGELDDLCANGK
jgi:hypothetical protein